MNATTTTTNTITSSLKNYQKEDPPVDAGNLKSYQKWEPPPAPETVREEDDYYIVRRSFREGRMRFFDECLGPIVILVVVIWLVMSFVLHLIRHALNSARRGV